MIELEKKIIEAYKKGYKWRQIPGLVGTTYSEIHKTVKKFGMTRSKPKPVKGKYFKHSDNFPF